MESICATTTNAAAATDGIQQDTATYDATAGDATTGDADTTTTLLYGKIGRSLY